jgi:acyl carrier protein
VGVRQKPSGAPNFLETDIMQRPQLITLFRDLASEIAEKDLSFVREDSAISDMGIDSLAMLELVGTMERELRIRVPDEQLVGLITVGQLLELVEGRITQAA